jgi:N-methylhydantoinase A/oxoprolinase/acetone carboxylase beta subunit
VAICLLHAYAHPAHEERLGQGLSPLGVPISLSSRVLPEIREYERTCATVLNAYLGPVLERYLGAWSRALPETPLYIQQSNGGFLPARQAGSWGLTTILSGPAGGVAGAFKVGQGEGANHLLTLDMGGTSTDVALLAGEIPYTGDYCLDGFPLGLPVMDIHTVGAGGGSIAYRDQGGALRVGPASAGADPGPVCYGQGGQVTVTDAQLFLGRLLPESFLGGRMPLALSATRQAVKRLSQEFGVGPVELCLAILRTANATMAKALAAVSLEKGYDPRQFTLLGFGGAGGLHVCELARELGIRRIIIPAHAGVLSALGMALAGLRRDFSRTLLMPDKELSFASLDKAYGELSNEALEEMKADCDDLRSLAAAATVELRYRGQSHTLPVPLTPAWREEFHRRHQRLYGHCFFDRELEAVLLRLSLMAPEPFASLPLLRPLMSPESGNLPRRTTVWLPEGAVEVPVCCRPHLEPGWRLPGPALIVEDFSTLLVLEGFQVQMTPRGHLILEG